MGSAELLSLMNTFLLLLAVMGGFFLARQFLRDRMVERHELKMLRDREVRKPDVTESPPPKVGPEAGGYIVLNLPEDQKSIFHDVLKGFEEYARLKGYSIRFSVDNTIPNWIAFKFTVAESLVTVSTQNVEKDLREYIEKVQRGDPLDDLPVVLPEAEHNALLLAMRNRIIFLQHTYSAQKNVISFYESVMRNIASGGLTALAPQNFFLQGGGAMNPTSFTSVGSQNVAQGSGNTIADNVIDQSVRIGNSFNDRKEQIEQLSHFVTLLRNEPGLSDEKRSKAAINLEKVKDEISSEPNPDRSRIQKWLQSAKDILSTGGLAKETVDAARELFALFGL